MAEIDSTNRWVADQARAGAPEGLVATAGHQTAGRGRLGRRWVAPPGSSLLVSVLLRPAALAPSQLHLATAAVSLAAAGACGDAAGVTPSLKWPNDLVVGDRKLGGLLAEAGRGWVVVGLGLNVDWPRVLPAELEGVATALNHQTGRRVDPDTVLDALLARLGELNGRWPDVARRYRRACSTVGRLVRVELSEESFTGTAADISDDGHLMVDVGACLREVAAGDVVHLRGLDGPKAT